MPKKVEQQRPQGARWNEVQPEVSDTESIDSTTDDMIKQLVDKYSGSADVEVEENDEENVEPLIEGTKKTRKRKPPTEKQLEHLAKTRELAIAKRKEYAKQRREEKEAKQKSTYEAEVTRRADEKLKEKIMKALKTKMDLPESKPKKKKKKKIVVVEESEESEESEEEEVQPAKPAKKVRKQKKPTGSGQPPPSYGHSGRWSDYYI